MLQIKDFFKCLPKFICPELFETELEGFVTIENIWDILRRIQSGFTEKFVKPNILGTIESGAFIRGNNIYLGKGSLIEDGAMVCGPAIIGDNVEIRHGAFVRGNVIIGDNSVIGHTTEVVRSIFLPGAKAPHFNYVGDSILGSGVNLGAGTKLSNLKNDGTNVRTKIDGKNVDTQLRKFGAILGDNCMLGCNSVTNPGTIMEPGGMVFPCASIHGHYKANSTILLRQTTKIVERNN